MGPYCCCNGCDEKYAKGRPYTFHTFPKDEQRAKLWLQKINRDGFVPTSYSKVCSKHFTKDCFYRQKNGAIWLKSDAVPTIFDFPKMQKKDRGGRKRPAKRKTRVSRCGVKASSQDHTELLESIQRKFVPILPAPDTKANRVWCILVPVVPKPGEIQPGSEKTGNGTAAGGESNNNERDSASDKMPLCHTVNLKEAFADTFVKEEPAGDGDESLCSAPEGAFADTFVKEEPVGDGDESVCSAPEGDYENSLAEEESREDHDTSAFSTTKEECGNVTVKQEPADDTTAAEEECDYVIVKEEPIDLDESTCLTAEEEFEYTLVKQEPPDGPTMYARPAPEQVCDRITVKLEQESQYEENLYERHGEQESEDIVVKDEPLEAEDPSDSEATPWVSPHFW